MARFALTIYPYSLYPLKADWLPRRGGALSVLAVNVERPSNQRRRGVNGSLLVAQQNMSVDECCLSAAIVFDCPAPRKLIETCSKQMKTSALGSLLCPSYPLPEQLAHCRIVGLKHLN